MTNADTYPGSQIQGGVITPKQFTENMYGGQTTRAQHEVDSEPAAITTEQALSIGGLVQASGISVNHGG